MEDVIKVGVITAAIVSLFGVFASCSYNAQKDYNACVKTAATVDIAELCERAK